MALPLLMMLFMPTLSFSQTPDKEVEAPIQHVTLHTDRALIQRVATISLKKGENLFRISGITPHMMDESLQSSLSDPGTSIAEVKTSLTFLGGMQQEAEQKLQKELDLVMTFIQKDQDRISTIESGIEFYRSFHPFPNNQKILPAELDAHVAYLEKSLEKQYEKIASIRKTLSLYLEKKEALENEMKNLAQKKSQTKNLRIRVISASEISKATLQISYLTREAGWTPSYDLRARDEDPFVELEYFAEIRQSTGEDWKNVPVEITTSRPSVYGHIPELSPWTVDIFQPRPLPKNRMATGQEMYAADASLFSVSSTAIDGLDSRPRAEESTTYFSFLLPGVLSIPSDGESSRILIAREQTASERTYSAIPRYSQAVYLKSVFRNPFAYPLLPGSLHVFYDQKLAGSIYLAKNILPEEEMNASLGVDESLQVIRKLHNKYTEYAGLMNRDTKISYEYLISLSNGKNKAVSLEIMDNLPLSQNEKIKINTEAPKQAEAEISEAGLITWKTELLPAENKELWVKFSVEFPKEVSVTGLE